MASKRTKPEVWNAFEERISEKRMNGSAKKSDNVPTDIMVQRMSATASGRLKKVRAIGHTRLCTIFRIYRVIHSEYQEGM